MALKMRELTEEEVNALTQITLRNSRIELFEQAMADIAELVRKVELVELEDGEALGRIREITERDI